CAPFAVVAAPLSCSQIQGSLIPCLSYLRTGGQPSQPCCTAVTNLNKAASTTPDRQNACRCLKSAAGALLGGLNPKYAAGLPSLCKVNIPYEISISTNCDSVK
ncbi:hypothetical protein F2P56_008231, partial [Juglans regia]